MRNNPLNTHFIELQNAKEALIGNVDRYTEIEQSYRPNPDKWNMLEIVEHLDISESGILAFFKKYDPAKTTRKPTLKNHLQNFGLNIWLKTSLKVKIPDPRLGPKGDKSFEELTVRWAKTREELKDVFDNFPLEKMAHTVFKHPLAGPLTMPQTIKFMILHIERHTEQVKKLADKAKG